MRLLLCALAVVVLCRCSSLGTSCTEMGCGTGASLRLASADGSLASGAYELSLDVGSQTHVCPFEVPADLPDRGTATEVACEPALSLFLQPQVTCTESRTGDSVSQSCSPIDGAYELTAAFEGTTPEEVTVTLSRDGAEVLNATRVLAYETTRPNGPDCEPVCRQATLEMTWSQ